MAIKVVYAWQSIQQTHFYVLFSKLDGVQSSSTGDVVLSIAVVTSSGQAHPTIYPTCFGKSMPRDWVEDDQNRTVMTVLRESEDYKKKYPHFHVTCTYYNVLCYIIY